MECQHSRFRPRLYVHEDAQHSVASVLYFKGRNYLSIATPSTATKMKIIKQPYEFKGCIIFKAIPRYANSNNIQDSYMLVIINTTVGIGI